MIAIRSFPTGPDKEAFHRYLTDFDAVADEAELLESLRDCSDVLPTQYANMFSLPPGSTYRDAVHVLLCSWTTTLRMPREHSCD